MKCIKYKSQFDTTGKCSENGHRAEKLFAALLQKLSANVAASNIDDQMRHIDLSSDIGTFDVKAQKRINRNDPNASDQWLWVEFKNVGGYKGWLYGDCDYFAFERKDYFIVVKRQDFAELCEILVDLDNRVYKSSDARYVGYTRKNRKDLVSMIRYQDIFDFAPYKIVRKSLLDK